jgi:galactokinase
VEDPRTETESHAFEQGLTELYGERAVERQAERAARAFRAFRAAFPEVDPRSARLFSTPGRTELGGNHTDHNNGRVLAASIQVDAISWAAPGSGSSIVVVSEGFDERMSVELTDEALEPVEAERGHPAALVRGVAAGVRSAGVELGGLCCYVTSDVLPGSGLSSSAAFEVLLATVLDTLFNAGALGPVERAKIAQAAENTFFGKPCGLMDQLACAVGGVVAIDFAQGSGTKWPSVKNVSADFDGAGYALCLVETGGSHAELTPEYAAVPEEMRAVAAELGASTLGELDRQTVLGRIGQLRLRVGDRALLRALHFFNENERVVRQYGLLEQGDVRGYLAEVRASGLSSWTLLQNYWPGSAPQEQGISLGVALAEQLLRGDGEPELRGAARVHGGGFAGTVQAYVPKEQYDAFAEQMTAWFGSGAVTALEIRNVGATQLL